MNKFHILNTDIGEPQRFTYPFNYVPHPLCVMAAEQLQAYIAQRTEWKDEVDGGKMFGVLVARDAGSRLGFLAAYSGLLGGRNDWEYFVPSVYDSQQPDGYFKTHEREISSINREIDKLENDKELVALRRELDDMEKRTAEEIAAYKAVMKAAKEKRDSIRCSSGAISAAQEAEMIRESQYQKAELKRLKKRSNDALEEKRNAVAEKENAISMLKRQRKEKSDSLQHWLFEQYDMLNARGEHRNLCEIFAQTPQGVPPSGAGDCCAPKLLQYAYENGLKPVCMAEFWWGRSPKSEIRHHLHYYPACRSKCKPILGFMLQGLDVDPDPHDMAVDEHGMKIVYSDDNIVVVSKPAGILSMPGLVGRQSVVDLLRKELGEGYYMPAHRLDMDTSGLLVVARTEEALRGLHEQFAARTVKKRYAAILDGVPAVPQHGVISLPLAPSQNDRPRQVVDFSAGKPAITEYCIERTEGGRTYIKLFPHTGRTHQLRVHCAHADGLATPILGDPLYGHSSSNRMMLHAEHIVFRHPASGKTMAFDDSIW